MDKKLRTAIIGMGRMGKTRYASMLDHGGYDICAICDTDIRNMDGFSEAKYTDWEDCINKEQLDAVIVCTYNRFIPDIVYVSLEKHCHVFAEKPPGRNLSDAIRMSKMATAREKMVLKFGFNHRYHNSVIEAKTLLDSGMMGEVIAARGVYGKAGSLCFHEEWRNQKEMSGGGILIDQGIHMVDLLLYLVGDFSQVQSSVDKLAWDGINTEDSAFAIMKTRDGKVASLHSSALQWKHKFDLDILCTKGYIALNGLLTSTKSYGEEQITYYFKDLEMKNGKMGNPKEYTMCFDKDYSWDLEMKEFYDAVTGKEALSNGTPQDAVRVMEIIERIYQNL